MLQNYNGRFEWIIVILVGMKRKIKKVSISTVGFVVLFAGIIMIPYPGPGWATVFAGLAILSTQYEWARRLLQFAKSKYDAWEKWLHGQNKVIQSIFWLLTAAVVVITLWLLNAYGILNDVLGLGWDWVRSPLPIFN